MVRWSGRGGYPNLRRVAALQHKTSWLLGLLQSSVAGESSELQVRSSGNESGAGDKAMQDTKRTVQARLPTQQGRKSQ
jgi:hypothetical protein